MRHYWILLLMLSLAWACGESSSSTEPETSTPTPSASSESTSSTSSRSTPALKPPYPIADSSDFVSLTGGIKLYFVEKGNGAIPKPGSNVFINYHGMLMNGTVFDSSFDRGTPADFSLAQLIQGWQIGLTSTPSGSKIKLFVPSAYGYGERGSPPNIPPNADLIFDIELISTY